MTCYKLNPYIDNWYAKCREENDIKGFEDIQIEIIYDSNPLALEKKLLSEISIEGRDNYYNTQWSNRKVSEKSEEKKV